MSSEEYDIWGMPIRPSVPAAEDDASASLEGAPSETAPMESAAAENAVTSLVPDWPETAKEAAPETPSAPSESPKQVTVAEAEIAAALAAVNEIAARGPSERKASEVAESGAAAATVDAQQAERVTPTVETPAIETPTVETPVAVVSEPARVEAVAPVASAGPEPEAAETEAATQESAVAVAAVAVAEAAPGTESAPVAPTAAEAVVATPAPVEVKPEEPAAKETPGAPVGVAATVAAEPSAPIDVWGDAPKTAAVVTSAVVASAVADEGVKSEVAEAAPKPIANPLRRKNATRSSNSPVAPTPPQYVATPGAAPAATLSSSGAPDPRYAISGTAAATAASPYALTPSPASGASASAAPGAPPLTTPVSTPIPPAATPMAAPVTPSVTPAVTAPVSATSSGPVPVYSTTAMDAPSPASYIAPPMATPVTAAIPPGSMPVMAPTAVAAAAVLSSAGVQVNRVETYAPPAAARPPRQAAEAKIEVINPEGWHRDFPLKKTILYVGSAPGADIVLPSSEIAPRHLQFVPSTANRIGYRLINLGAAPVSVLGPAGGEPRIAAARGSLEMGDGDRVDLGGYGLVFHGGEVTSQQIQARLEVPNPRLTFERPLDGALYIRNGGEKAGVQFVVEVQGIDSRYVQIEPGPVLFPGMEKRVAFRISHPQTATPAAGDQPINFVVTAPEAYPGETAIASQVITVAPFFAHKVRLIAIEPEMSGFSLSSGR